MPEHLNRADAVRREETESGRLLGVCEETKTSE